MNKPKTIMQAFRKFDAARTKYEDCRVEVEYIGSRTKEEIEEFRPRFTKAQHNYRVQRADFIRFLKELDVAFEGARICLIQRT